MRGRWGRDLKGGEDREGSVLGLHCKILRGGILKRDGKGIYIWLVWAEMSLIDRGYG